MMQCETQENKEFYKVSEFKKKKKPAETASQNLPTKRGEQGCMDQSVKCPTTDFSDLRAETEPQVSLPTQHGVGFRFSLSPSELIS